MNCLVFIDSKPTLHYKLTINIIRETLIFYALLLYVSFPFLHWVKFCNDCFRQVFFIWETIKVVASRVRQMVVLYIKNCMGICLGGLINGPLRRVVIL